MPNKSHKITKANLLAVQELFITSHHSSFAHHVLQHVKLQMVRLMFCFLFFFSSALGNFHKMSFFSIIDLYKSGLICCDFTYWFVNYYFEASNVSF